MSDITFREPHVPHVDVKLVVLTYINATDHVDSEKQIQDLMNDGYRIEAYSAVSSDNRFPRFIWTMVRRFT